MHPYFHFVPATICIAVTCAFVEVGITDRRRGSLTPLQAVRLVCLTLVTAAGFGISLAPIALHMAQALAQ